jgi:hypothetical protein
MKAKKREFREPEYQYVYGVGYVRLEYGKPVAIVSARKLKAARRRKGK